MTSELARTLRAAREMARTRVVDWDVVDRLIELSSDAYAQGFLARDRYAERRSNVIDPQVLTAALASPAAQQKALVAKAADIPFSLEDLGI